MTNLKEKVEEIIEKYHTPAMDELIEEKVVSLGAKLLYKSGHKVLSKIMNAFATLRTKFDGEKNYAKKMAKKIGLILGGKIMRAFGNALVECADIMTEGLNN